MSSQKPQVLQKTMIRGQLDWTSIYFEVTILQADMEKEEPFGVDIYVGLFEGILSTVGLFFHQLLLRLLLLLLLLQLRLLLLLPTNLDFLLNLLRKLHHDHGLCLLLFTVPPPLFPTSILLSAAETRLEDGRGSDRTPTLSGYACCCFLAFLMPAGKGRDGLLHYNDGMEEGRHAVCARECTTCSPSGTMKIGDRAKESGRGTFMAGDIVGCGVIRSTGQVCEAEKL
eukprot:755145-Hanusia_phi.AAC.10